MKLIHLINYMEQHVPLIITIENTEFAIKCHNENLDYILKNAEKKKKIENLVGIMYDKDIKKIDYSEEFKSIVITLRKENLL